MSLSNVETLARQLMTDHGVGYLDFAFDGGKNRLGACHYRIFNKGMHNENKIPFKITISRHYALLLPVEEIEQTILHEIAHALVPNDGHGPAWRQAARRLGHTGSRCAAPSAAPAYSVIGRCPVCTETAAEMHRLPLRVSYCRKCVRSGAVKLGDREKALQWFKNGRKMTISQMPERYRFEFNNRQPVVR